MTIILRHLGVACMGHFQLARDSLPHGLIPMWERYATNALAFPHMLTIPALKRELISHELSFNLRTPIARAAFLSLAVCVKELSIQEIPKLMEQSSDIGPLTYRLQSFLRIRLYS